MAAKILQGITGRWESCIFLLTALLEQGAGVASAQLLSVTPHLEEGDGPPDFMSPIVGRARRLKATMLNLVQADHRLYKLDALLVRSRKARKESISALAAAITDLRLHVKFHYENPDLVALGLHSLREFTYTARSFEAECRLAGKKELSRRVRPSEHRPGETEVPPAVDLPLPEPGEDPPPLPVLSPEESQALFDSE